MSTQYIEIDSEYRDRNEYPNPASFIVGASNSGQLNNVYALDPICNSGIVYFWATSFCETSYASTTASSGLITATVIGSNTFKITLAGALGLRQINNFYCGAVFKITIGGLENRYRITKYTFINLTTALLEVNKNISDGVITADGVIQYPEYENTTVASPAPRIFVPNGSIVDNYYYNMYIGISWNSSNFEYRRIVDYDGSTRVCTLDTTTTNNWNNSNVAFLYIRKEKPFLTAETDNGALKNVLIINLNTTYIPGPLDLITWYAQLIQKSISGTETYSNPGAVGQARKIISYETIGNFLYLYVFPSFDTTSFLDKFVLLPYTRDNYNPIIIPQKLEPPVQYEIELLNLILPNTLLQNGSRAINYPYFYVQLEPIYSTAITQYVIYSNNFNSVKVLFRAVVDDNIIPTVSPFIKLDGDGMIHTINFKLIDYFRFSVFLPNGELFQTVQTDSSSPDLPNPNIQISACFACKRK